MLTLVSKHDWSSDHCCFNQWKGVKSFVCQSEHATLDSLGWSLLRIPQPTARDVSSSRIGSRVGTGSELAPEPPPEKGAASQGKHCSMASQTRRLVFNPLYQPKTDSPVLFFIRTFFFFWKKIQEKELQTLVIIQTEWQILSIWSVHVDQRGQTWGPRSASRFKLPTRCF